MWLCSWYLPVTKASKKDTLVVFVAENCVYCPEVTAHSKTSAWRGREYCSSLLQARGPQCLQLASVTSNNFSAFIVRLNTFLICS